MSRPKKIDKNAVLQPIRGASYISGLSQRAIRDGCRNNTIPHVMVGRDYRVHMPSFLAQLAEESRQKRA